MMARLSAQIAVVAPLLKVCTLVVATVVAEVPKPSVPFAAGSAPVSFYMNATEPHPQWCSLLRGAAQENNCTADWTNVSETYALGHDTVAINSVFLDTGSGAEFTLQGVQYTNRSLGIDGAVEWQGHLRNAGSAPLAEIGGPLNWDGQYELGKGPALLLDWTIGVGAAEGVTVQRQRGSNMTREDFSMVVSTLTAGSSTSQFFPNGRSSDGWLPLFNVNLGATAGGIVFCLGWSGNWVATVERSKDGSNVTVRAGLGSLNAGVQPWSCTRGSVPWG
eukprot:SAG31_NODE_4964_length_2833_cov_1.777981_3_plen_276_part_00